MEHLVFRAYNKNSWKHDNNRKKPQKTQFAQKLQCKSVSYDKG